MGCAQCSSNVLKVFIRSFDAPLQHQLTLRCQPLPRSSKERRFKSTSECLRASGALSPRSIHDDPIPYAGKSFKQWKAQRPDAHQADGPESLFGGVRSRKGMSENWCEDLEQLEDGSKSTSKRDDPPDLEGKATNFGHEVSRKHKDQSPLDRSVVQNASGPDRHVKSRARQANEAQIAHNYVKLGLRKQLVSPSYNLRDMEGSQPRREEWQIQKKALSGKFGSSGWQPRKRLSPDALDGIRSLHAQDPDKHSTSALADQFEVSPEAIRRILKSKWRPNDDEEEDRKRRWERRGRNIWSQMSQLGIKPPKRWRANGAQNTISNKWMGLGGVSMADDTKPDYIPLADRIL